MNTIIKASVRALVGIASPALTLYDIFSNNLSSAFSAGLCLVGGRGPLPPHKPSSTRPQAVVVTGGSAGIGRETCLRLARRGYLVFAGVRKASDGEDLKTEYDNNKPSEFGDIIPVILDVTHKSAITNARNEIKRHLEHYGAELAGLVNVAGIIHLAPLENTDDAEIRKMFDVNFFGVLDICKAFMPELKRSRGRIINIGSAASFIVAPSAGIYSASKAAIAAATEALRMEVRPFGVGVSLIEPGCIKTRAWDIGVKKLHEYNAHAKGSERSSGISTDDVFLRSSHTTRTDKHENPRCPYEGLFGRLQLAYDAAIHLAFPPKHISQHVEHALGSRFPRERYLGGIDTKVADFALKFVPQKLVETAIKWVLW
ncbi:hypothetical protein PhCBS80983_g02654 [Powellomyces hirtus]|uniref:Uncharacterized protein n=1 Tax=Powellomyces hirtus TaxID=109895 RepID=A0A507E5Y9_9FUNG|nr:hypothetical protein PhCBS80983_g02654 [Powellomyces hirtus]